MPKYFEEGLHRFVNPWAGDPTFVNLGTFDRTRWAADKSITQRHDLYALVSPAGGDISFGARFGNEGHEYLSGTARYREGGWKLYLGDVLAVAAARYFANHHKFSLEELK